MRQLDEHGKQYLAGLGSNTQNTVRAFAQEIAVGDVIISIDGQDQIGAVGVVTRDYFSTGTGSQIDDTIQPPLPMHPSGQADVPARARLLD